ncbi:MAG: hypothetical protein CVU84_10720 [Firmicutes bacterium HGW-Firmicutes-1]|jgi:hypothetical protein|nr:MAG: hypothetical protein CVU84_10720 [Firmicutes bacterium HGW-Firmicutes-1]
MPRRDGTGPLGLGVMSGRGLGVCGRTINGKYGAGLGLALGLGVGFGCRRGFGRNFFADSTHEKEMLTEDMDLLKKRVEAISKRLGN